MAVGTRDFKILSATSLKIIALISMLIDHIGVVFFPGEFIFRKIGRLAFPIFAYLIGEGMVHTKSVKEYQKRLLFFAVISEIPFDLAFSKTLVDLSTWNIMFTLLMGTVCIDLLQKNGYGTDSGLKIGLIMIIAQIVNVDGGAYGVLVIVMLYLYKEQPQKILLTLIVIYGIALGWIYRYAILAYLPIYCYNHKRGAEIKWITYWFYPIHLLVLAGIYTVIRL